MKINQNNLKPVIPAQARIQSALKNEGWTPAFAGVTKLFVIFFLLSSQLSASVKTPEDAILSKAFAAYMDGRNKVAYSYFEEVIQINPKNKAALKGLEKVKIRLKKTEDKEKEAAKRLAESKVKEGKSLLKTNDVISAIDSFHAATDAVPNFKKAEKAMKKLRKKMAKTLQKKKFNLSNWAFARGVLAYMDRDWAKAFRIWSQRAQIEPSNIALANAKQRAENKFMRVMLEERQEFLRRGAREFYRQGLYNEAIGSWRRVLDQIDDDAEALEGLARAEEAIMIIEGKDRDRKTHDLLEQGLQLYASQNWGKAKRTFQQLVQLDPDFNSAKEYLSKINKKLSEDQYRPIRRGVEKSWREARPSNQGGSQVAVPGQLENVEAKKMELESQLKRDPSNIKIQQELDKMKQLQDEESERIYKDGLIAYSQGNRSLAIDKWKQVLVLNPEHKKASAALRKARAEEERTAQERYQ